MSHIKAVFYIEPTAALVAILFCSLLMFLLVTARGPKLEKSNRLGCLDGLRGFLAMGVFLRHYVVCYYFHLYGKWDICPSRFYYLIAKVGVALFFTITGFLFWHKIWVTQGRVNWRNLYFSRIFRIVPLYWSAVVVVTILVFATGVPAIKVSLLALVLQIVKWLSFLWMPDINGFHDTGRILAFVQWTLKYEWLFYFSLPILALAISYSKRYFFILPVLACLVILGTFRPFEVPYVFINTKFFIYFMIGALAASFYDNEKLKAYAQSSWVSLLAIGALGLLFIIFQKDDQISQYLLLGLFFIPVALGNSLFGLLKLPIYTFMGDISYSIYLLHGIILYILFSIIFPDFLGIHTTNFMFYMAMSAAAVIVVCISWMTHFFLEKPFMDLGKNLAKNK